MGFFMYAPTGATGPSYCATCPEIENRDLRGECFIPMANELRPNADSEDVQFLEALRTYSKKLSLETVPEWVQSPALKFAAVKTSISPFPSYQFHRHHHHQACFHHLVRLFKGPKRLICYEWNGKIDDFAANLGAGDCSHLLWESSQ